MREIGREGERHGEREKRGEAEREGRRRKRGGERERETGPGFLGTKSNIALGVPAGLFLDHINI